MMPTWMSQTAPLALLCLALAAPSVRADFVQESNLAEPPESQKFFIDLANNDVSTFTGHIGAQNSGPLVTVNATGNVDSGSGWATVTPVKDGILTSLVFTPDDPNAFGDFTFRGQLVSAGSVTVTVQDNQGDPSQSFTFSDLPKDADFDRLGIEAKSGSGETIQSVTVSSDGFKEFKLISLSPAGSSGPPVVPEPSSAVLLGLGMVLAGICRCRFCRKPTGSSPWVSPTLVSAPE